MTPRTQALSLLVLVSTLATLVPHPLHMVPLGAMAIFAGATFTDRRWAFAVPLAARLAKDLLVEFNGRTGPVLDSATLLLLATTYVCLAVSVLLALPLRHRWKDGPAGLLGIGAAGLGGWAVFFLLTNAAYWVLFVPDKSLAGLLTTYAAGVPFGLRQLLADFVSLGLLFGVWATLERAVPAVADETASRSAPAPVR